MRYYYDRSKYSSSIATYEIREKIEKDTDELLTKIKGLYPLKDIRKIWTRRNSLGYVFTDFPFEPKKRSQRLIGKGESELLEEIKERYECLFLSDNLPRNSQSFPLDNDKEGLMINIDFFKDFVSIIRNKKNTVKLFLYHLDLEKEQFIRNWLKAYPDFEQIREQAIIPDVDSMIALLAKYKINSSTDLQKLIELSNASEELIREGYTYFEKTLDVFHSMIISNLSEEDIRDFIFKHIWLLDFKYLGYRPKKEEECEVGYTDMSLYSNKLGTEMIAIVELKRSDVKITSDKLLGMKKSSILSPVGRAISQIIHYIEVAKKPYVRIEGIVIIGRRLDETDNFIDILNGYLHGIKIVTFDELYKNALQVVNSFKALSKFKT